jgi:PHD/YefM family antitoxin component YafN of YafNO toxin-antitoxin module
VKRINLLDAPEELRDFVREAETMGARTVFERNGRAVAILVSYDEYLAMSETLAIANDSLLFARLAEADEEEVETRWSYRTDDLRIIYKIVAEARIVVILSITKTR